MQIVRMSSSERDNFQKKYIGIFNSNIWYVILIILICSVYTFLDGDNIRIGNTLVLAFSLCIATGRVLIPVLFEEFSWVTKGWLAVAIAWICVIFTNIKDAFYLYQYRWINDFVWYFAYLPYFVFIIGCFIQLEFRQRGRWNLLIDTVIASSSINVVSYSLLRIIVPDIKIEDLFFFSINFSIVYSLYLIFQQGYGGLGQRFRYLGMCFILFALIDLLWAVKEGLNARVYTSSFYALTYMIFSKATLIPVYVADKDNNKLLLDSFFQQILPYVMLVGGMTVTLITDQFYLSIGMLVLLIIKSFIQANENIQLMRKLDKSRSDAEQIHGLLQSSIHDIREPISVSTGMIAILEKGINELTSSHKRALVFLKQSVQNINDQMNDLLDISNTIVDEDAFHNVDIKRIAFELKEKMGIYYEIRRKGNPNLGPATINTDFQDNIHIKGRDILFERIITNLVKNSLENHATSVLISSETNDTTVAIIIQDNGRGYPPTILKHGIQPGFTHRPDGYGLGLMSVAANVRALHGSIIIDNNGGARTKIYFPRIRN